jgi:hypothetical protein
VIEESFIIETGDKGGKGVGGRKEREGLPGPYKQWGGGEYKLLRFVVMLFPFVT